MAGIFTAGDHDVVRNHKRHLFVYVYCTCKMPETFDSRMVQCDACKLWFHFKCVGLKRTTPDYLAMQRLPQKVATFITLTDP